MTEQNEVESENDISPIAVVQDDNIHSRQVDTETASAHGEQEDELLAPGLVVLVNRGDSVIMSCTAIDMAVLCTDKL